MFMDGLPLCPSSMMLPYEAPVQHTIQHVPIPAHIGVPIPQPVPVPVHVDRPYPLPVPHPVPVPIDRPCAVPYPVHVPVPQPMMVPQPMFVREPVHVPVPVPVPVSVPVPQYVRDEYHVPSSYCRVERIIEEPVRIKVCRRRRRRRCCRTPNPLPPIIIPYPVQAPVVVPQAQPRLQVTEYVQDIYPPAQIFTEQVPVGYVAQNSIIKAPDTISNQHIIDCQQGFVIPSA